MAPIVPIGLLAGGLALFFLTRPAAAAEPPAPVPPPKPPNPGPAPKPAANCAQLLADIDQSKQALIHVVVNTPDAQGDICNAAAQLDRAVAIADRAGCTGYDLGDAPAVDCDGPPYVPPGVDCEPGFAALEAAKDNYSAQLAAFQSNPMNPYALCQAAIQLENAAAALTAAGCEVGEIPDTSDLECSGPNPSPTPPRGRDLPEIDPSGGGGYAPEPEHEDAACDGLRAALDAAGNAYTSALSNGDAVTACAMLSGFQGALAAARRVGCYTNEWSDPNPEICAAVSGGGSSAAFDDAAAQAAAAQVAANAASMVRFF